MPPIVRCKHLESLFPKLTAAGYEKTSEKTGRFPVPGAYNCIAWAANDTHNWWWPDDYSYWPRGIVREEEINYFMRVFERLRYRRCDTSRLEFGYEKVAIYALGSKPKHMARQLRNGAWTSKCGEHEDITHFTLDAVESYGPTLADAYGAPRLYMKRSIVVSWFVRSLQWMDWTFKMGIYS